MTATDWTWLTQGNEVLCFEKGSTILKKGDPFSTLFFIKEGIVRVDVASDELSSVVFRNTGDVMGELEFAAYKKGLIKNAQSTLIAEEDTQIVALPFSSIISMLLVPSDLTNRFYYHLCCLLGCISQQSLYYYSLSHKNETSFDSPQLSTKQNFQTLKVSLSSTKSFHSDEVLQQNRKRLQQEEGWLKSVLGTNLEDHSCPARYAKQHGKFGVGADKVVFITKSLLSSKKPVEVSFAEIKDFFLVDCSLHILANTEYIFHISQEKHARAIYSAFLVKYGERYEPPPQQLLQRESIDWRKASPKFGSEKEYSDGEYILRRLECDQALYQIISGECLVIMYYPDGTQEETILSEGNFIGQYSFLFGEYSILDAIAMRECKVLRFSRKSIATKELLKEENRSVCSSFLAMITHSLTEHIDSRFCKTGFQSSAMIATKQPRSKVEQ